MAVYLSLFGIAASVGCIVLYIKLVSLDRRFKGFSEQTDKKLHELILKNSEPEKRSGILEKISEKLHDIEAIEAYIDAESEEEDYKEFHKPDRNQSAKDSDRAKEQAEIDKVERPSV